MITQFSRGNLGGSLQKPTQFEEEKGTISWKINRQPLQKHKDPLTFD
jgi:hypothetical protein